MSTPQLALFGAVTGLVGAVAGVGALVWQIVTWFGSNYNVKVSASESYLIGGPYAPRWIQVKAINDGRAPVTIESWGITTAGKRSTRIMWASPASIDTPLPHRLERGASASFHIPVDALQAERAKKNLNYEQMIPFVRLATGREKFAKKGLPDLG
jgi:hypothetical protein